MRRWARAPSTTLCGGCGAEIAKGAPVQLNQLPTVKRELKRCEACAGPAPAELPPLPEHMKISPRTKKMTALRAARPEWLGYKDSE